MYMIVVKVLYGKYTLKVSFRISKPESKHSNYHIKQSLQPCTCIAGLFIFISRYHDLWVYHLKIKIKYTNVGRFGRGYCGKYFEIFKDFFSLTERDVLEYPIFRLAHFPIEFQISYYMIYFPCYQRHRVEALPNRLLGNNITILTKY